MTTPITVLTGFLGAGKTTLLNQVLRHPRFARSLVIVNELGTVPLDHLIVREAREDVLLLDSGCVCCSVRGDLVATLAQMGDLMPGASFDRVLVETTGLADPTPIIATLVRHPEVAERYHLDAVLTAVDGEQGGATLDAHPEALKQVLVADDLVLTKVDRASPDALATLRARLLALTGGAVRVHDAVHGGLDWDALLRWTSDTMAARLGTVGAWEEPTGLHEAHGADVHAFALHGKEHIHFSALALWLSMASQFHGAHLLRVKGLVGVTDEPGPLVVQAVQHVVHPTYAMPSWPTADRRSRIQVIARGLPPRLMADLRASLAAILGTPIEPSLPIHAHREKVGAHDAQHAAPARRGPEGAADGEGVARHDAAHDRAAGAGAPATPRESSGTQ
jgi:G3E family GTPase